MYVILNIITDDKFIDDVISAHELIQGDCMHIYALVGNEKIDSLRYIKAKERLVVISETSFLKYIVDNHISAIFLHSLFVMPLNIIPRIPSEIRVFWFSWGYDIYRRDRESLIDISLFHKRTYELINKIQNKNLYRYIIDKFTQYKEIRKENQEFINAVSRIDYFSGVLPTEYELCRKKKYFKAQKVQYYYWPPIVFSKIEKYVNLTGRNILVGNSAIYENNHIDVLQYLKHLDLKERLVYMPLSYGKEKGSDYINYIKKEAFFLGHKFKPLTDFASLEEYISIVRSCNVAIFFMERQQALGNILMLLLNGCKVFLSETSIMHSYLKSLGLRIYSVQSDLNQLEIDTELTQENKTNNLKIITSILNEKNYVQMLDRIYNIIRS